MHIEDLIILLSLRAKMNPYDDNLVHSFHDQISRGSGLTEKQAVVALKILSRQQDKLCQIIGKDISDFINNPTFRLGKRTVNNAKRITVIDYTGYGRALKVEFPYSDELVAKIRQRRSTFNLAQWDKEEKAWIFSLDERAISFLEEIGATSEFELDEEIAGYLAQVQDIKKNFEKYVPMVSIKEGIPIFANIPDYVPQPKTSDPLEALFLARKAGIQTWDDTIDNELQRNGIDPIVKKFLDSSPDVDFEILLEEHSIFGIKDIIRFLRPCIFVIPGGSEMEKVQTSIELLKSAGVTESEISVLFRLPKETGEKFNNFVRDQQLNNPVTDSTQAVFISSKVPKTIIEPKIKFNSVVNFNFYSVHYTIREFLKNHHNVMHVLDKKPQRNMNFGFL